MNGLPLENEEWLRSHINILGPDIRFLKDTKTTRIRERLQRRAPCSKALFDIDYHIHNLADQLDKQVLEDANGQEADVNLAAFNFPYNTTAAYNGRRESDNAQIQHFEEVYGLLPHQPRRCATISELDDATKDALRQWVVVVDQLNRHVIDFLQSKTTLHETRIKAQMVEHPI
ncbi:hypothetical protein DFJ77DRAFT_511937 [Powellomyces hirtus]|nr:hypothetical protein DFJ77DRAFT_511937 [Powellomyces hirtus]